METCLTAGRADSFLIVLVFFFFDDLGFGAGSGEYADFVLRTRTSFLRVVGTEMPETIK